MITFEDIKQMVRESSLESLRQRAFTHRRVITVCQECKAFVGERNLYDEPGWIEVGFCGEHMPIATEVIQ